ncbi:MAG: hypothetical protein ACK5WM_13860, partial [Rhodospirillales bacterium]
HVLGAVDVSLQLDSQLDKLASRGNLEQRTGWMPIHREDRHLGLNSLLHEAIADFGAVSKYHECILNKQECDQS